MSSVLLQFTTDAFPLTATMKEKSGLPWGCVVQPMADIPLVSNTNEPGSVIARCNNCYAYINPYATISRRTWRCTLCRTNNELPRDERYVTAQTTGRDNLPELKHALVEYSMDDDDGDDDDDAAADLKNDSKSGGDAKQLSLTAAVSASTAASAAAAAAAAAAGPSSEYPAYIFLVDISGRNEYIELVKSSILAAVEALSPQSWVGLAVFSSKLGCYDLRSAVPHVKYIRIPQHANTTANATGSGARATPTSARSGAGGGGGGGGLGVLSLRELMALDDFVVRLGECKSNISAAVESLSSLYKSTPAPASDDASNPTDTPTAAAGDQKQSAFPFSPAAAAASPELAMPPPVAGAAPASPAPAAATSAAATGTPKPKAARRPAVPQDQRKRGFGFAITSLIDFVTGSASGAAAAAASESDGKSSTAGSTAAGGASSGGLSCVRILSFLSGIPNFGPGALDSARYTHGSVGGGAGPSAANSVRANYKRLMAPQSDFYQNAAERAARSGVCMDVYVVSELSYTDLATLKSLTILTGGNLLLYELSGDAALPQDVFRQLNRKSMQIGRGLLRVRTSPEFAVGSVYGHCIPDATYDNLFHMAGCDARKVFVLDFEFASSIGFNGMTDFRPTVQLAFAYNTLRPNKNGVDVPSRRLRVFTRRIDVAQTLTNLYGAARVDTIVTQLTHKLINASLEQGLGEARLLAKDWLVNFTARYNEFILLNDKKAVSAKRDALRKRLEKETPIGGSGGGPEQLAGVVYGTTGTELIDLTFPKHANLAPLSRHIFGLLKNPILSTEHTTHPDQRTYLQCLYSGLEPEFLCKSIYPQLSAFRDLNTPERDRHMLQLSQAAVSTAISMPLSVSLSPAAAADQKSAPPQPDTVFLIDNFIGLYVLYSHAAEQLPLPPPQNCELRRLIKSIKSRTPLISPRVIFARPGMGDARYFDANLLEDGAADTAAFSYQHFTDAVAKQTVAHITQ